MPSITKKQQNFMRLVHAVQNGVISPFKVGKKVATAARSMKVSDVKDFLMEKDGSKKCDISIKSRLLKNLKEIIEPMRLEESTISSTNEYTGLYDRTINMYRGIEFFPQELQAISNFKENQTEKTKFIVKYDKADEFGNNIDITIKKLKENDLFVYVAFIRHRTSDANSDENNIPTKKEKIKIIKSSPFKTLEGSKILTNFIMEVYRKNN
jgi:hypothetical protein